MKHSHDYSNATKCENSLRQSEEQFSSGIGDTLESPNFVEISENEEISVELGIQTFTDFCSSLLVHRISNSIVDFVVKEMSYCFSEMFQLVFRILRNFSISIPFLLN